jgi:putative SOS response-associated peptidase YedK
MSPPLPGLQHRWRALSAARARLSTAAVGASQESVCGRFTLTSPAQAIAEAFGVEPPADLAPRYNIAPSQDVLVVRAAESGERTIAPVRWGLVPWWSKEIPRSLSTINARAESAAEKPAFRDPFRQRRCLVPANGFYEWQPSPGGRGGPRQPFLARLRGGEPFAIAGLWERWRPRARSDGPSAPGAGDGERLESCAILTTAPNPLMAPIHDRMPVLLPPEAWDLWLDPREHDVERLRAILRPFPAEAMEAIPVTPWVNDPRHDDPRCVEPQPRAPAQLGLGV